MVARRLNAMVAVVALTVLPMSAWAQEKGAKDQKEREGLFGRVLHLMPPTFAAELNLTAEQRTQIQKLEQEFKTKRVESLLQTVGRVMAIVESMDGDDHKELAPVLALAHEITGGLLESRRARMGYEKKMVAVLNPEQQAKLAHLKERRPRDRRDEGAATFHFYPPQGQERLQLTDEQRRKVDEMQRDIVTRFRSLLTEEQRKIFDEMMTQREKSRKKDRPNEKQDK